MIRFKIYDQITYYVFYSAKNPAVLIFDLFLSKILGLYIFVELFLSFELLSCQISS